MSSSPNFEPLIAGQRAKKDSTRERIVEAMRVIEQEISEHGLYPHNDGKVSLTEVARRAGVGSTTLRNAHHHETRERVQKWLKSLGPRAPTTAAKARKASREKIAWYEDALRKVNAEAIKWRTELAALQDENRQLREQINEMEARAGTSVVGIRSRSE